MNIIDKLDAIEEIAIDAVAVGQVGDLKDRFADVYDEIQTLEAKIKELEAEREWRPMETAPKGSSPDNPSGEHWILGINEHGEQRVIRWCCEYPCTDGVWMFAYEPTDYIDNIQEFNPVGWMPLPKP